MEENYINIGKINIELFKNIAKDIITDEVILTRERYLHIIEGHKEDFCIIFKYVIRSVNKPRLHIKRL